MNNLTFLQIGLGSMGKRRIRNLLSCGIAKSQIFGFDRAAAKRKEAEKKYRVKTFASFQAAVKKISPDVYIISTPPDQHNKYFLFAAKRKKHFFVEVSTTDRGYDKLLKMTDKSFIAAPSCTFRFLNTVQKMKSLIKSGKIGKVLSFNYHVGQYLPDWHPRENYRKVFFAKKRSGGCRELFVFEFTWLTDTLGSNFKNAVGFTDKVSDLPISADDVYAVAVQLEGKITGTLLIELLSRTPLRILRVVGSKGILEWNWLESQIRLYEAHTGKWKTISLKLDSEQTYQKEMNCFLRAIHGKQIYPYTFAEDKQNLAGLKILEKR